MANENRNIILILLGILALVGIFNSNMIGTTSGALGFSDFEVVWTGLPQVFQTGMFVVVFIVIITFLINSGKN